MFSIWPTRAFFHPGEPISLVVESDQPIGDPLTVSVYHFDELITRWTEPNVLASGKLLLTFPAPSSEPYHGYLVQVQAGDQTATTAFDVLDHWTQAPRYGFLYDFAADRSADDIQATLDHLLKLHVNGLQFYDWQYRHDTLLPPQDEYTDPLDRRLSLATVRALIETAHDRGMAAMPYTAIYAASPSFAAAHPDWQLYDSAQQPIDFADGFLKIINPDSGWRAHFIQECQCVLEALPFDGIHVDQYGEPQTGFDSDGNSIDLSRSFAELLTDLRAAIGSQKTLLFNLVHNWPANVLADTPLDFWYSELWPPDAILTRLWQTICANHALNPRPAVLAVYVRPEWEHTINAVQSMILAAGGTHIAHGDHGRYLSDPYFPKAGLPSESLARRLQQLADFSVAYEEALIFAEDVTEAWLPRLQLTGLSPEHSQIIIRASGASLFVHLLNFAGRWDEELPAPLPLDNVRLSILGKCVKRRWCASPEAPLAVSLTDDRLPKLNTWLLVGFELEDSPP